MKTIAFFNHKGGVGKTSLVHHLAWMFRRLGVAVLALDLDPQSNLTSAFLAEERLAELWQDEGSTILGSIRPLLERSGGVAPPHVELVDRELFGPDIGLVPGDLGLGLFEDRLAEAWIGCLGDESASREEALRVTTSFREVARQAAGAVGAAVVLLDLGPSLGAINRAALVASDHVVVPLGADLFSVQGLRSLGATLRRWRREWQSRRLATGTYAASGTTGDMAPLGYVVLQHAVRMDNPVHAYERWMRRVPDEYRRTVLDIPAPPVEPAADPHRLGAIRHYRSLVPLAQERRKAMFELTPADGLFGGQAAAVQECREDFESLARRIAAASGITL